MNKRGIVFTVISVILVSILILMFLIQANKKTEIEITKSTVQADTLNSFVKSLKTEYVPAAIRVSSDRALLGLIAYMDGNGYLADIDLDFNNSLLTGLDPSLNPDTGRLQYMFAKDEDENDINYTIYAALNEVQELASQTQVIFSYKNSVNAKISQKDSWTLKVTLENFNFTVSSLDGKVKWTDIINISGYIPITNYRDPVILMNENLNLNENLNITIQQADPINGDFGKLVEQIVNHTFNSNPDAPSFLQRMEGDFSSSNGYGIEYIVNPWFNDNSLHYSLIDHNYYYGHETGNCDLRDETGYPNLFLDDAHMDYYGFSSLISTLCNLGGGT